MTQSQKTQRKKVFVSHDIQGNILGRLAKYWIFYHLGLWCILFTVEFFQCLIVGALIEPGGIEGNFFANFALKHWVVLILPILLFPAIMWDMLHLTHHVAGPLVRFLRALRTLSAGQPVEKIKLRKGDLLTEFQDAFNEFLDSEPLRNGQSLKAVVKLKSHSEDDDSNGDDAATLDPELYDGERQTAATANHETSRRELAISPA